MARPSKYSAELVKTICERLSKGEPLAVICRDEGMPSDDAVRDWMERDDVGPEVSRLIARAREKGEDAIAIQALEILDEPPRMTETKYGAQVDSGDVALRRARFEGRLKLLAKWNPRRWGERQQIEHTGKLSLESLVTGGGDPE